MNSQLPPHHAAVQDRAHAGARLAMGGVALNVTMAAVKFAGGIWGHTYALIADGIESLLDVVSSLLVWGGMRVAARPPDENHPFGHGRAEPLAAFAGASLVFVTAALVAWRAVHEILTPHRGPDWETLPLLAGIVVVKLGFFRRLHSAGDEARSTALGVEAWRHWSDAITSAAAFIGILIAIVGGDKCRGADDWAALFACVVVVVNGVIMLSRATGEIMDIAVPAALVNEVRAVAAAVPGVVGLEKCRVRKSGLSFLIEIHVLVDANMAVREGHAIAHKVKNVLLASALGVTDVVVHIEPA